jgi:hypothetical protein
MIIAVLRSHRPQHHNRVLYHKTPGVQSLQRFTDCGAAPLTDGTYFLCSLALFDGRQVCLDVATEDSHYQQLEHRDTDSERFFFGDRDTNNCYIWYQRNQTGAVTVPGADHTEDENLLVGWPKTVFPQCTIYNVANSYHWQLIAVDCNALRHPIHLPPIAPPIVVHPVMFAECTPNQTFVIKDKLTGGCVTVEGDINVSDKLNTSAANCNPTDRNNIWVFTKTTPGHFPNEVLMLQ